MLRTKYIVRTEIFVFSTAIIKIIGLSFLESSKQSLKMTQHIRCNCAFAMPYERSIRAPQNKDKKLCV